jgi:glycosyltransferase involved in cell wall biosynthesis
VYGRSCMSESILIISLDMIPYAQNWGGCQRIYFLSEFLQKRGFNIIVIHLKTDLYNTFDKGISFITVPIDIDCAAKHNENIYIEDPSKRKFIRKYLKFGKHLINQRLISIDNLAHNEIDSDQGNLGRQLVDTSKKDLLTIIKSHNIKKVIISGPPFSLFGVISYLKNNIDDLRVILDYRDPWNLWNKGNPISRYREQTYLRLADRVVFINERLRDDTIGSFNLDRNKCNVVFNGYSEEDWKEVIKEYRKSSSESKRLIISYVGSISFEIGNYRDLSIFWAAFEKFNHKDEVTIRFIGPDISIGASKLKNRFKNSVEFISKVAHKQSLNYMLDSDILFLVHTDERSAKYVMTGKLFDYARSGKVILGIASSTDTYFIDLIKKCHLGITSLNTENCILGALDLIYWKWKEGNLQDLRNSSIDDLKKFSRDNQNEEYIKLIEKLD